MAESIQGCVVGSIKEMAEEITEKISPKARKRKMKEKKIETINEELTTLLKGQKKISKCFKCGEKRELEINVVFNNDSEMKTHTAIAQGSCTVCGTNMHTFVGTKESKKAFRMEEKVRKKEEREAKSIEVG
jgi:hypothetical protein